MRFMLDNIEDLFVAILLAAMTAIVAAAVFFRYILVSPFQWAEEVALGLFVWLVFVGAASGSKRGAHPAVDVFFVILPASVRRVVSVVGHLIVLALLAAFVVIGWSFASQSWNSHTIALKLPMFWIHVSVVVGGCLMFWRTTERLVAELRNIPQSERAEYERVRGL